MAALVCDDCTTVYSVGALKCPHCGSKESHQQGEKAKRKPKPTVK